MLPKASCDQCAETISKVELFLARNTFNSFRVFEQLPTRKPRKSRKTTRIKSDRGFLQVPVWDAIATLPQIDMAPPGLLRGLSPELSTYYDGGTTISIRTATPKESRYLDTQWPCLDGTM